MGITAWHSDPLTEPLFSKVQARLLAILFGQAERQFQGAELIRLADAGTGATHRQLQQLTDAGLLVSRTIGTQKFYQANRSSPIFRELESLVLKTVGLVHPLREALEPIRSKITAAFVYGSIASGESTNKSDVDLLVLSDSLDYSQVFKAIQATESVLAREISPTVMSMAEWDRKRLDPDSFAARLASGHKLWVIGDEAAIT